MKNLKKLRTPHKEGGGFDCQMKEKKEYGKN